jgi:hypothetical protein
VKLLLEEMWPPAIAAELRRRGHDVEAVAERRDLRSQPDRVVFQAAQAEGRAVVTENVRDFRLLAAEILRRGLPHAGRILTRNRSFPRSNLRSRGRVIRALDRLLSVDADLTSQEWWLAPSEDE